MSALAAWIAVVAVGSSASLCRRTAFVSANDLRAKRGSC